MVVEIWSDVVCPFCYIGKRKFETALNIFPHKDEVGIIWKSFQLSPMMVTDSSLNGHEYLARHKNMPIEQAKKLNKQVADWAVKEGLVYNFDKAIAANSFNAHRYSHFAKKYAKQHEAEEQLFKGYFTDGLNIDDSQVLCKLATELGLDGAELERALKGAGFAQEVMGDIEEAGQLGIQGVPFFVFNRKYAISGAQDVSIFSETLEKARD